MMYGRLHATPMAGFRRAPAAKSASARGTSASASFA